MDGFPTGVLLSGNASENLNPLRKRGTGTTACNPSLTQRVGMTTACGPEESVGFNAGQECEPVRRPAIHHPWISRPPAEAALQGLFSRSGGRQSQDSAAKYSDRSA
ncbi:hypothetical protein [Roseimaritima multifibrata]|nr:hypothetical protein [Roseimaritima multifibrata]